MIKIKNCPVCGSSSFNSFVKTTAQMHHNDKLFNFDKCNKCDFVFLNPRLKFEDLKTITPRITYHIGVQKLGGSLNG